MRVLLMSKCQAMAGPLAALLLIAVQAQAEDKETEPSAIVEIGGAAERSIRDGGSSFGPSVAVEVTPLKDWLELEAGFTPLFSNGHPEWSTDFLFKKPFTLSKTVEFMVGVGPEWTYTNGGGKIAGEFALDFMFWPWPERKIGWFLEPSYSYSFSRGHEQSLGVSVGLLIPIP
jgi:hypothetical protein